MQSFVDFVVWCLGSSLIKRAFVASRSLPGGPNLDLRGADVWWQGYGGLGLAELLKKINILVKVGDTPSFIILHCGGNDIGKIPCKQIRKLLQDVFQLCAKVLPNTKILWSEVLPRSNWRYSTDGKAMERARKRLNSYAGKLAIDMGGGYLRHPILCSDWGRFECPDGVHLSDEGNVVFLKQIRNGINQFRAGNSYIV